MPSHHGTVPSWAWRLGLNFDAAMQALGRHQGDRTLFFWFRHRTWIPLIFENVLGPMELAHVPYKKNRSYEDYVGTAVLKRQGEKNWRHRLNKAVHPSSSSRLRGG